MLMTRRIRSTSLEFPRFPQRDAWDLTTRTGFAIKIETPRVVMKLLNVLQIGKS
jgi:hypothetical protein